jgi:hypothetical protein
VNRTGVVLYAIFINIFFMQNMQSKRTHTFYPNRAICQDEQESKKGLK